ncbi:hypothetical protein AAHN97_14995 [Chitinophaga niabensis]|uniref:hypothetical protein n=1 Tax=Chitinophaga niabensis TaxID=536979 RepID=UPI0031BBC2EF
MVIKIWPKFTAAEISRMIQERLLKVDAAIIARLLFIGEKFVKNAREKGGYRDQTGNLRNSIGYIIMRDGVILMENFRRSASVTKTISQGKNKGQTRTTSGSKDGLTTGKAIAYQASAKFPEGYVLIVVAGMDYAAAVESRGKDVITGSSLIAKEDLKKAMKQLPAQISKMR